MGREHDEIRVKVEHEDDGWRVYTSRNANGWWAVGVPFASEHSARSVARAIEVAVHLDRLETTA